MIKMMAAICRKPGMTHAEYLAYGQHVHGAISNENPVTLRRYVQNHVFDAAFGSSAEPVHAQTVARDSVTELWWDSPQDMAANFAHEHVRTKVFMMTPVTEPVMAINVEDYMEQPDGSEAWIVDDAGLV